MRITMMKTGIGVMVWAAFLSGPLHAQPRFTEAAIEHELNQAHASLVKIWSGTMRYNFAPPRLVFYSQPMKTGCGPSSMGDAFFCETDNAIYIDPRFVAALDKRASDAVQSPGNFAGIVAIAHEFGHALERHTSYAVLPASESAADCFAGATTRQIKADGLLSTSDISEALFLMDMLGDDKVIGYGATTAWGVLLLRDPDPHGSSQERQAAFLRGYYGGPAFCTDSLGAPKPPAGGRILASLRLAGPQAVSGAGSGCVVSPGQDGVHVRNTALKGGCVVNLLDKKTLLPDHVRIEVTVKPLTNAATRRTSMGGIYFGDARATGKLVPFGDEIQESDDTHVINMDSQPAVAEPTVAGLLYTLQQGQRAKSGEEHLTLDIHHEGKDVFFIEYLNGVAVKHMGLWEHGTWRQRLGVFGEAPDQAGLWLSAPGAEAVFSDFRITALPEWEQAWGR